MDRTTRAWGSPATPADDFADIMQEISEEHDVKINVDLKEADYLLSIAPADLTEHTKSVASSARIMNKAGKSWTYSSAGFEATNIGFQNGDLELQEKLTRNLIDAAVDIGAKTLVLPECGHAYGAARWEAARWYGGPVPVRVLHMTELLDELIKKGEIKLNKVGETASFHDPCQLVRRGGVEEPPRRILKALGFEIKELKHHGAFAWCCGGGGGVASNTRANPLRYKAFELKRGQVDAADADHFITACGVCRITLDLGAKHFAWDKHVESLLELVADNMID